jgi:hypothetical protein
VSDGWSIDGTYEVLQRLAKENSKIRLFRYEWPSKKAGTVLAEVTNAIRQNCKGDYIFSIQANEVVHEDSAEYIKALPEMFPEVQTFSFPFLHLLGSEKWAEGYRLRFAKNLPEVVAVSDAWSLGYTHKTLRNKALEGLTNPKQLYSYLGRGIEWVYANNCDGKYTKAVYLPKPIYRYWSLFPQDHLKKCLAHAELFNLPNFKALAERMQAHLECPDYWQIVAEGARADSTGVKYPASLCSVKLSEHPALIQRLLCSNFKTYRESIEC